MAAAAIVVGHWAAVRRASRRGFDFDLAWRVVTWTVLLGLVGSHLGAILLYEPQRALARPMLLLEVWGEMSSTGGIVGGAAGGWWAMRREGLDGARRLAFLDAIAYAFPFAWLFGRAGCALAHDHLGIPSTSFLAVAFPGGARLDLGLLELLWTIAMCAAWPLLDRRPRPVGFFLAAWLLAYTPVRLILDALRTEDARLFVGLTAAQAASLAGFGAGLWLAFRLRRGRG
jgi:phosphatidylglycerol:prolipoprotein diacylglycerol transferase